MGKTKKTLLIRADADKHIGSGHVMRCLALAQAWLSSEGRVTLATTTPLNGLNERLKTEGIYLSRISSEMGSIEDALSTASLAQSITADWIVLDGYHFDDAYQLALKNRGENILLLDDYGHATHYYVDLILNQNVDAREELYRNRESYTKLLLDTEYTLLRREFLSWTGWEREIPKRAKKLLVTLGGGDPENMTTRVVESLQSMNMRGLEVIVILGSGNPHQETVEDALNILSCDTQILRNTKEMPHLMAWADIAVTGGGSTCWESAFMGLPSAVLVLADNQSDIAAGLHMAGVVLNLGPHEDVDSKEIVKELKALMENQKRRKKMSLMGKRLVDGRGSMRVLEALVPNAKNNGEGGLP